MSEHHPSDSNPSRAARDRSSEIRDGEATLDRDEDARLAAEANVDALFRKYSHRSLAFLSSLGIRGADAEDVMQRAWMKVMNQLRKRTFEGNFRGWLFQILRNAAIDHRRKKRPDDMDPATVSETLSTDDDPSVSITRQEYRRAVAGCVDRLPDQMRTLVQRRILGDAYSDIGEQIGLSVPQCHRLFFTAKETLARCLSGWEDQA